MKINVHAGHNPDGKIACGAVGILRESSEARRVKDEVISQLKLMGHTVNDCTVNNGTSQADILTKIIQKCNAGEADLDISIHFNAGAADLSGNGVSAGTEVFVYNADSKALTAAKKICDEISSLGFRNRGVKYSTSLYVLRKSKAPSLLVECCFVDDKDDVQRYDYKTMAQAIVRGIGGNAQKPAAPVVKPDEAAGKKDAETPVGGGESLYRVQVGAYRSRENAEELKKKLEKAGFDALVINA